MVLTIHLFYQNAAEWSALPKAGRDCPGGGRFQIEKDTNIIYDALAEIYKKLFSQRGWAQLLGNKLKR
jgi:hypothetical protein